MVKRVRRSLLAGICLALVGCASGQTAGMKGPAPTATSAPTATPMPTSATWRAAPTLSTSVSDLVFSPSAPQRGYYCIRGNTIPSASTQWLFRSDDGGMAWQALSGIALPSVTDPGEYACYMFMDAHDANDVFVQMRIASGCGGMGPCTGQVNALWRSRDGGASWSRLNLPPRSTWTDGELQSLIVSGSRLIGLESDYTQAVPECATDANANALLHIDDLVASDDGGQTWHTIGQSMYDQGLSVPGKGEWVSGGQLLQNNGASIVVHAACDMSGSSTGAAQEKESDWISRDNGATWSQLPVNGGSDVEAFSFVSAPSGGTYGAAVDLGSSGSSGTLPAVRYSDNGGASWHALPTLSVVPDAQTTDAQVMVRSMTLMPDGTVLTSLEVDLPAVVATSMPGTPPATLRQGKALWSGTYVIDPHSAHPVWQPFTITPSNIALMNGAPLSKTSLGWVLWGNSYNQQGQVSSNYCLTPLP